MKKLFKNIVLILITTILLASCSQESSDDNELVIPPVETGQNNGCLSVDTDQDGIKDCLDSDIDNDSYTNCLDFPIDLASEESCNQDAFPFDRLEWIDDDNDRVGNNSDWAPFDPTEQVDKDNDLIGDNADPDDDNDGVPDIFDQFFLVAGEAFDIDGDGLSVNLYEGHTGFATTINIDPDRDNDGVPDVFDDLNWSFNGKFDIDGDLIAAEFDADIDGDNVINDQDIFPYDPNEAFDFDRDKIGNNADPDDDNDGYPDIFDDFPLNKIRFFDSDKDGFANLDDWAPFNSLEWQDNDNDGFGDNIEDEFPFDGTEWADLDKDGIGDNSDPDIDGDGFTNEIDAFPFDRDDHSDRDGDLIGDSVDPDNDNDGYPNVFDEFPFDQRKYIDFDNDDIEDYRIPTISYDQIYNSYSIAQLFNSEEWIGPNQTAYKIDPDSDNDGIPDYFDDLAWNPIEWADIDKDGLGANVDLDDDGDTFVDEFDLFPYDKNEWYDNDNDRLGDNEDFDDDNDGFPDVFDEVPFNRNGGFDIEGSFAGLENDNIPNGSAERVDAISDGYKIKVSDTDYDGDTFQQAPLLCKPTGNIINYEEQVLKDPSFFSSDILAWNIIEGTRENGYVDNANSSVIVEQEVSVVANNTYTIFLKSEQLSSSPNQTNNSKILVSDEDSNIILDHDGDVPSSGLLVAPTLTGIIKVRIESTYIDTIGVISGRLDEVSLLHLTSNQINDQISCTFDVPNFDVFPFDGTEWADNDNDEIGNNADPDDDNDGVPDVFDSFPLDLPENVLTSPRYADLDFDTIPNSIDNDLDGDGVENTIDVFPYDSLESSDNDSDLLGDIVDPDDDNDGVPDIFDDLSLDANYWRDRDGDGIEDENDIYTPNGINDETDLQNGILAGEDIFIEKDIEITSCITVEEAPELPPSDEREILISSTDSNELYYTGPSNSCVFNIKKISYLGFEGIQMLLDESVRNTVFFKATESPTNVGFLQFTNVVLFLKHNNRLLESNVRDGVNFTLNTIFVETDEALTGANQNIISFNDGGANVESQGAFTMYSNILYWTIEANQTAPLSFVKTSGSIKYFEGTLNTIYFNKSKVSPISVNAGNKFFNINLNQNISDSQHGVTFVKNRIRKGDDVGDIFNLSYTGGSSLDSNLITSRLNYMNSNDFDLGNPLLNEYSEFNTITGLQEIKKSLLFYSNRFDETNIWLDFEDEVYLLPYYPHLAQVENSPALYLVNPNLDKINFCANLNNETDCVLSTQNSCSWNSDQNSCSFQAELTPVQKCEQNIFVAEDTSQGISSVDGELACNDDTENFCSWDTSSNATLLNECQVYDNDDDCNGDTAHYCFWDTDLNSCTVKGKCSYTEPDFVNICLAYNSGSDPEAECNADTLHSCTWREAEFENEFTGCQYAPIDLDNFVDVSTELAANKIFAFQANDLPEVYFTGALAPILDTDQDFVADDLDEFPLDPNEFEDNDKDGIGNNADLDDDNDDLLDEDEINIHNTDPLVADTDEDGDNDGFEILNGTDPLDPFSARDSDGDGLSDNFEITFFTGCIDPQLTVDTDGDGLGDKEEYEIHKTNPCLADTDNDGLNDFEEINTYGTFPKVTDSDADGVSDGQEIIDGTNPANSNDFLDTDGDGVPNAIDNTPFGANNTASFDEQLTEAMSCGSLTNESSCRGTPLSMCVWSFDNTECTSASVTLTEDLSINKCYDGFGIKIKTSPNVSSKKKITIPASLNTDCNFGERGVFNFRENNENNTSYIENIIIDATNKDKIFSIEDAKVNISGTSIFINDDSFDGSSLIYTEDNSSSLTISKSTIRSSSNYVIPTYGNSVSNGNFSSNIVGWFDNFFNGFIDSNSGKLRLYPFDRVDPLEKHLEINNTTNSWNTITNDNSVFSTLDPSLCGATENCFRVLAPQGETDINSILVEKEISVTPGKSYSLYYKGTAKGGRLRIVQSNNVQLVNLFAANDALTAVKTNDQPVYFTASGNFIKVSLEAASYKDGLSDIEYEGSAQLAGLFLVEDQICRGLGVSTCANELACYTNSSLNQCIAYTPEDIPNAPDPVAVVKEQLISVISDKSYRVKFVISSTGGSINAKIGSSSNSDNYGNFTNTGNNSLTIDETVYMDTDELYLTITYDRQGDDSNIYGFLDSVLVQRIPDIPQIKPIIDIASMEDLKIESSIVECDYKNLYGEFTCVNLDTDIENVLFRENLLISKNITERTNERNYTFVLNNTISGNGIFDFKRNRIYSENGYAFLEKDTINESTVSLSLTDLSLYNKDQSNNSVYITDSNNSNILVNGNLSNFMLPIIDFENTIFESASTTKLKCALGETGGNTDSGRIYSTANYNDYSFSGYADIHPAYFTKFPIPQSYMNLVERTQGSGNIVDYIGGDNTLCR